MPVKISRHWRAAGAGGHGGLGRAESFLSQLFVAQTDVAGAGSSGQPDLTKSFNWITWGMDFFEAAKSRLQQNRQRQEAEAEFRADFTPRLQQALIFAAQEAREMKCDFLGVEHMLIGLLMLGGGVMVNVLQKSGLTLDRVRGEVRQKAGHTPHEISESTPIPFTPRAKRALTSAKKEAAELGHKYTGTEHLLLGLLAETDGVVWHILKAAHLNPETMRKEVLAEITPIFP
jgi:hypothetical protein